MRGALRERHSWILDLVGMAPLLPNWGISEPLFRNLPGSSRNMVAGRTLGLSRIGCASTAAKLGVLGLGRFEYSCVCRRSLLAPTDGTKTNLTSRSTTA